ncbi:hypothetical protein RN001_010660 [Aquatica leii]|uniref:CRAL-TRIO domain-containing protein n=1 Tax=Aquatica leii TaxID=1421715 RepID=A0AAN7P6T8_9COLE|nr:hypothetical protein RN001_010660 [Aquatica leii]
MTAVDVIEKVDGGREKLLTTLGQSLNIVGQDVENIRNWFAKQPHLPEIPDYVVIERFLIMSKFYVETVKIKLDMYYTVRSLLPEFYNQHPCSDAARAVENVVYLILMPRLSPSLNRIICWKLKDTNPDNFDAVPFFSYLLNLVEIRVREDVSATDTYICDLEGFTFNHMIKFTPMVLKKLKFISEKVFTIRSKQIYILNAPSFVDTLISLLSKYVKPKLIKRIVVCKNLWVTKFEESKLLFDHLMSLRVDESLRLGKPLDNDVLGIQGNFRQLVID